MPSSFLKIKNKQLQFIQLLQWRHLFAIEIFFERGFAGLNGLKTPSGNMVKKFYLIVKIQKTSRDQMAKINKKNIMWINHLKMKRIYFLKV